MIMEIRTYRLKPGTRDEFLRVMLEESVPLLTAHGIDVIAAGASLTEPDDAYLIRAFASLEAHQEQEETFYASQPWLTGPREAIVSRIDTYHTIVIETTKEAAEALRH
ncbi:NIPSNAP family protein [Longispora albida]|uniref:NIPSNAP family protein n=1 Tax=Longispora albida TaxID=203523 RepID=UPI00039CC164|nr:NIPSNAP family protein [Longispora albida]